MVGVDKMINRQWTKVDDSLQTENYGDVGYIYKDGIFWVAVVIFENGDEMDTPCSSAAKARLVVEKDA